MDAIFRHESQKDRALFPGADPREFWQRARDRNRVRTRTNPCTCSKTLKRLSRKRAEFKNQPPLP